MRLRPWCVGACLAVVLSAAPATYAGVDTGTPLQVDAQIGGNTSAVAVAGGLLYLGIGTRIEVLDVSEPSRPLRVGSSAPLPEQPSAIAVASGYAFVADGDAGVYVLDVHDPTQPVGIGTYQPAGASQRVVVDGSTAYVAAGDAGLHILDVSDPSAPQEIGNYNAAAGVLDVALGPGVAYVAVDDGARNRGMRVALPHLRTLDVSDPRNPIELGIADVSAGALASSLMVADPDHGRVYQYWNLFGAIGCDTAGIHVLDVSDPTTPTNVADLPATCGAGSIAGNGDRFAVAASAGSALSLYRPGSAQARTDLMSGVMASGVALDGTLLFVAGEDQASGQSEVRVFDTSSTGGSPAPLGTYAEAALSHAQGTAAGQRIYLGDRGRFSIVDLSQPDRPVEVGAATLPTAGGLANWAVDVSVVGAYAYVIDGPSLLTFSIADPTHPTLVNLQDLGVGTFGVAHAGAYLYVIVGVNPATPGAGLQYELAILDLTDPAHPQTRGTWSDVGGLWNGLVIDGTRAYLTAGRALNVLDVVDALHPRVLGSAPFTDVGGDRLAITGQTVFVNGFEGVHAYDVTDPTQPVVLPVFGGDGGLVSSVALTGLTLYAAYWSGGGLRAFDVSDPTNPVLLGAYPNIPNGSVAASVFALGGHVLTSTYSGLWVLHITPTQ